MGGFGKGYMNFIDPLDIMHHPSSSGGSSPTITEPSAALPTGQESGSTSELLNTKGGAQGDLLNPGTTTRQSVLGGA